MINLKFLLLPTNENLIWNTLDLNKEYRIIIENLLSVRVGFTQKLIKDTLLTLSTQQDEVTENEVEYDHYRSKSRVKKGK